MYLPTIMVLNLSVVSGLADRYFSKLILPLRFEPHFQRIFNLNFGCLNYERTYHSKINDKFIIKHLDIYICTVK